MVFNTGPYTVLPDSSIFIKANMQSETGFPSSHQLMSYVASKSRLKLAARCPVSGCWPSCTFLPQICCALTVTHPSTNRVRRRLTSLIRPMRYHYAKPPPDLLVIAHFLILIINYELDDVGYWNYKLRYLWQF